MYHRYGRHGPHAWKRWRERRFQRRLPVVVPTVAVVRVQVPIIIERIIFIIMSDGNAREELEVTQVQLSSDQPGSLVAVSTQNLVPMTEDSRDSPSSSDAVLIEETKWQAYHDTANVAAIFKEARLVRIHEPMVEERIKRAVNIYLEKNRPKGGPPNDEEQYRLLSVSRQAYWGYLYQIIREKIKLIATSLDVQLRDQAVKDRETYPAYVDNQSHLRDLAVLRVLSIPGLSMDYEPDAHLDQIHDFADKYEYYFRTPGEEVIWPTQDSF